MHHTPSPFRCSDAGGPDFRHKEHPKRCAEDDFWGQVSRTINGRPVDETQIAMIVDAIVGELRLASDDCVLDLGCGNGALADRFWDRIGSYVGVDFSDYLVGIAGRYFSAADGASPRVRKYICLDAASYVRQESTPMQFTKALCYGAFPYFSPEDCDTLLSCLGSRFSNVERLLIGNLPDRDLAQAFFLAEFEERTLDDPQAPIGIWRSRDEFRSLAARHDWDVEFRTMPEAFYAAHYRYDALLTRRS